MPPLHRVYAYRDAGPMGPTRWAPRRTVCTQNEDHSDLPGGLYVAKFCQGTHGAAAMISEVVCRELFRAGGLHVLDAVAIEVSQNFASSWNSTNQDQPPIAPGEYFGTVYIPDVYAGPINSLEQLESPNHLALIWLFDCLVCNIDRDVRGNLILLPRGNPIKLRLLPADNSDCFCGSLNFSNGQWQEQMKQRRGFPGVRVAEAINLIGGTNGLQIALRTVREALGSIGNGFDQVPASWWEATEIRPEQIEQTLWERVEALPNLLNFAIWEGGFAIDNFNDIPIL